jgi:hypothetical protein
MFLKKSLVAFLVLATSLISILDVVAPLAAQPQDKCGDILKQAESKYEEGLLDETIALVNRCLDQKGLSLEESENAYKLLGKAYHAKGLLVQSKENLKKLLELIPNWRPNPDLETPSFVQLAEEVIKEMEAQKPQPQPQPEPTQPPKKEEEKPAAPAQPRKKGGSTKWFLIGGGAVAAGVAVALAGGGGGGGGAGGNRLPDPPPLPQ